MDHESRELLAGLRNNENKRKCYNEPLIQRQVLEIVYQKMKKEASLKRKMKAQDEGERSTSKSELPEFRSSNQLLRVFKVKREKIMRNLGRINTHMTGVKEPSSISMDHSEQVSSALFCLRQRNTYQASSSVLSLKPMANFDDPGVQASSSNCSACRNQKSVAQSHIAEIVEFQKCPNLGCSSYSGSNECQRKK